MLFVLFQLGQDRYALEASHVIEIVPFLALKRFPQAPKGVAGVFIYRGQTVPAVDLNEILYHRPAQPRLSTRIIIINHDAFPLPGQAEDHRAGIGRERSRPLLGLIAERATATMRCNPGEFQHVGVNLTATPCLGPVLRDDRGVIQLVHAEKLLTQNIAALIAPADT